MIPSNALPYRQRVTLIRPARVVAAGVSLPVAAPLGLASLAAVLLDAGHDVIALDALGEGLAHKVEAGGFRYQGLPIDKIVADIDPRTTIIGVSCMFSHEWPWIARLIAAIRRRHHGALIVAGGEHITALAEVSLRDCPALDICVLGEGEAAIVGLAACGETFDELSGIPGLAFLDGDRFVRTPPRARINAPDRPRHPAWHLFPVDQYFGSANAFGHKRRSLPICCATSCSNESMYGTIWTPRLPADVVDEIKFLVDRYEIESIDFCDLAMTVRKDWVLEFCSELERRCVKIAWQLPSGTRVEIIDDEVAAALYRAGCRHLVLTPESGSTRVPGSLERRVNLVRLERAVHAARRHGLTVNTSMLIGFPDETRTDVLRSIASAWRQAIWGVDATSFMMFAPYPGPAVFGEMRARERIAAGDRKSFRSLSVVPEPRRHTASSNQMSGLELAVWRLVGMGSFVALALALRPARLGRLVTNVVRNRCETMLEQRMRGWLGLNAPVPAR